MSNVYRYRCCQHCVDPCPANGHTTQCGACGVGAVGRLWAGPPTHPDGAVRDWRVRGRRTPEKVADRKPIVMDPLELVRSVPR